MNGKLRRFLIYYLPLLVNIGLIAYLAWQLSLAPYFQRQGEFQIFSVLYAVGGLVIAVSGITAFIHLAAQQKGPRPLPSWIWWRQLVPSATTRSSAPAFLIAGSRDSSAIFMLVSKCSAS